MASPTLSEQKKRYASVVVAKGEGDVYSFVGERTFMFEQ